MKDNRLIHFHIHAFPYSYYLYEQLSIASHLLRTHKQVDKIVIKIHPYYSRGRRKWLTEFLSYHILALVSQILPPSIFTLLPRQASSIPSSIYYKVFYGAKCQSIYTASGIIVIEPVGSRLYRNALHFLISLARAWLFIFKLNLKKPTQPLAELLIYRGIRIGTHVMSSSLRHDPSACGSSKKCRNIYLFLAHAKAVVDYAYSVRLDNNALSYSCLFEISYIDSLYPIVFQSRGATVIWFNRLYRISMKEPGSKNLLKCAVRANPLNSPLTTSQVKEVKSYMSRRLGSSSSVLSYMSKGENNSNQKDIYDLSGNRLTLSPRDRYACIYLHSVNDAQLRYGYDGFPDVYEWALFTMLSLLESPHVDHVLLKPHPNLCYKPSTSEGIALRRLLAHVPKETKKPITVLCKSTSLYLLAQLPTIVSITHHGSVAEEMTFLGKPVLGSTSAPWGTDFPFLYTWSNPTQYKLLLLTDLFSGPDLSVSDALYRYIWSHRLNFGDYRSAGIMYYCYVHPCASLKEACLKEESLVSEFDYFSSRIILGDPFLSYLLPSSQTTSMLSI